MTVPPCAPEVKHCIEGNEPWFLPKMKTDVMLTCGNRRLIIDAKCYGSILGKNRDVERISAGNTYQIFSYVMHAAQVFQGNVSGMLLYAQIKNEPPIDGKWTDLGHDYYCRTLNLDNEFDQIATQLNEIAAMLTGS